MEKTHRPHDELLAGDVGGAVGGIVDVATGVVQSVLETMTGGGLEEEL